jgi:hypothetical protein
LCARQAANLSSLSVFRAPLARPPAALGWHLFEGNFREARGQGARPLREVRARCAPAARLRTLPAAPRRRGLGGCAIHPAVALSSQRLRYPASSCAIQPAVALSSQRLRYPASGCAIQPAVALSSQQLRYPASGCAIQPALALSSQRLRYPASGCAIQPAVL